ncbi:hypothetical protein MKW98_019357 [Papaver atlanticum]|uniref:Uncharacterized protein n=1 Tax=Papaver atlanticum TaxID=357466 RepID=A0AAD4S935_9MAGN|nr:hypothetical protein MKW98_019357 [Papaver atlanticum]
MLSIQGNRLAGKAPFGGTNSFTSWQFFLIRVNCNYMPRFNVGSSSRSPSTSSWPSPLLITIAGVHTLLQVHFI